MFKLTKHICLYVLKKLPTRYDSLIGVNNLIARYRIKTCVSLAGKEFTKLTAFQLNYTLFININSVGTYGS